MWGYIVGAGHMSGQVTVGSLWLRPPRIPVFFLSSHPKVRFSPTVFYLHLQALLYGVQFATQTSRGPCGYPAGAYFYRLPPKFHMPCRDCFCLKSAFWSCTPCLVFCVTQPHASDQTKYVGV